MVCFVMLKLSTQNKCVGKLCADCSDSSWHVHKRTRPGIISRNLSWCSSFACAAVLSWGEETRGQLCSAYSTRSNSSRSSYRMGATRGICFVLSFALCKAPLVVSTCVLCTYCTYGRPKAYSTLLCQDQPLDFAVFCCNAVGKTLHIFPLTCGLCGCHALTEKIWTKNVAYANFLSIFSQHSCNS